MKKKFLLVGLIVLFLLVFVAGNSFSYFKKTFIQDDEEKIIVGTDCFDISLVDVTSALNITNATPMNDVVGLSTKPYSFKVKNICNSKENLFVQLDLNKDNTMLYDHIKVALDGDLNLNPTYLTDLTASNSINDSIKNNYNEAKVLATTVLNPEDEINLNLRVWLDDYRSDADLDYNKVFYSKVEIISALNTEFVLTKPYIEVSTNYVGNGVVEAIYNFKSDSTDITHYYISLEETENPSWVSIDNPSHNYEKTFTYTESNTYYLYAKDSRGDIVSKQVIIDVTDIINPEITDVLIEGVNDNQINVTVTASDDTGILNYYYSIDGENYFSSEDAYYEFINLPQEDYIVYVYAEDAALNKSLVVTRSLRLGTPAVRIDDDYYFSIEKAANASSSGDTLIVLRDIVENADIPVGKNFTLDIAGYTIYSNYSTTIDVYGSDVTITDSTWDEEHPYGTGMFTFLPDVEGNGTGGAIYGDEYSNITLEHLTIKGNSASLGGGVYHKGNLILDSVLIEENHASSNGGGLFSKSGTISFKNNTIIRNNTSELPGGGWFVVKIDSFESDSTSEISSNNSD